MIYVIASIEIVPGKREEFLKAFHQLMPAVHAEVGCIEYSPTVDVESGIDLQSQKGENIVTVMEKWESVATLNDHLAAPHMSAYREQVQDIVVGMTLHILEPA